MDAVEEIKARLNIEDVISEYVDLKRAGQNFKGLSPFAAERTPSFIVSPAKGIWHDFSSGKGGNVFSFVMEVEGLDFKEALELLARKANVDLEQFRGQSGGNGKLKERLYAANEAATKFYQVQFSKNTVALEYVFKKRQFTKTVALDFRLGYAPNTGHAMIDYLKKLGFTEDEARRAGLIAKAYRGGIQDMFRGRLMIPLQDAQGRVIGFTARQLDDDPGAPKYLNTPQTMLYDKSRQVYGLHLAKDAIRKSKYAVMVEGNLDVIASHQADVKQVVATAGTALTEMHMKTISRFSGDIRLAFDEDRAGQAATERAIPIASKVGVSLSIVTIPDGKDPDELIKKDPKLWLKALDKKVYALDWLIAQYQERLDLAQVPDKREFSDVILRVVRALNDPVEQDHYLAKVSKILGVSQDALTTKFSDNSTTARPRKKPKVERLPAGYRGFDQNRTENQFICLMFMRPGLRDALKPVSPDMFTRDEPRLISEYLKQHPDFSGEKEAFEELGKMQNVPDYVKMLGLYYEATYQDQIDTELRYEVTRLQIRLIEQFVKTKKTTIMDRLEDATDAETRILLQEVAQLDALLKS